MSHLNLPYGESKSAFAKKIRAYVGLMGPHYLPVSTGTMTGNETFTQKNCVFVKDPGGANRTLNPASGVTFPQGTMMYVINTADASESITFDSSGLNQAVAQNQRGIFTYDGSDWRKVFVG